jgi:hypothetical protein
VILLVIPVFGVLAMMVLAMVSFGSVIAQVLKLKIPAGR